jgi:hypothetical protein
VNFKKVFGLGATVVTVGFVLTGCANDPTFDENGVRNNTDTGASVVLTVPKIDKTLIDCLVYSNSYTVQVDCDWEHVSTNPVTVMEKDKSEEIRESEEDQNIVTDNFEFFSVTQKNGETPIECVYIKNTWYDSSGMSCNF